MGQALKAREAVPEWFIETGKSAFAWHNIDAELAQLTYDSEQDRRAVAVTAVGDGLDPGAHLYLGPSDPGARGHRELAARPGPPAAGRELEIQTKAGVVSTTEVDEIGCFSVDPIPDCPFRLRCRTADGTDVLTGWITI